MRLIDADAFAERMIRQWDTVDEEKKIEIVAVIANIVTPILVGTPTIDADAYFDSVDRIKPCPKCRYQIFGVEPAKRGRWENGMQCPFCKQIDTAKPNFCCNCGAKLDGDEKDAID